MLVFQYWNEISPPVEVAKLIQEWSTRFGRDHALYDQRAARDLVASTLGSQAASAFDDCALPAMQADLFRYVALWKYGGLWVDADTQPKSPLPVRYLTGRGLLFTRHGNTANDVLYVRNPEDPLIEETLQRALANVRERRANNVWEVTGPGIMTNIRSKEPELAEKLFDGIPIIDVVEMRNYVQFRHDLEYKQGEKHWHKAQDRQSIFVV